MGAGRCIPSWGNKLFSRTSTGDEIVALAERGWAAWVINAGVPLTLGQWEGVSIPAQTRLHPESKHDDLKKGAAQTAEDLELLYGLMAASPEKENELLLDNYALVQFAAIRRARDLVARKVDEWHVEFADTDKAKAGATIAGYTSAREKLLEVEQQASDLSVRVPGRVAKGDRDPFKLTRFEHRPKLGWGTTTQAKRRTFGMAMSAS
jgi:hypothetical protein